MMDWDNTRVVFTKRTLIEFLRYVPSRARASNHAVPLLTSKFAFAVGFRYTGTTVDTNFSNIQKLPSVSRISCLLV